MPPRVPKMPQRGVPQKREKLLNVGSVPRKPEEKPMKNVPDRSVQPNKRVQLEGIRAGENMKKKRERLCSVLIQKLVVKYGAHNESIIGVLVDQFVEEKAQIAPEDLARLEKEVVLTLKQQALNRKAPSPVNRGNQEQAMLNPQESSSVSFSKNESNSKDNVDAIDLTPPPAGSEWKVIAAWQELQNEAKADKEKYLARQKKIDFKNALDNHIADSKKFASDVVAKSDAAYQERMLQDVAKFHAEEKKKRELLHERGQIQLQGQRKQIADAKLRHEKEMEELRKMEVAMLADAADKIAEESEKQARIRRYAKEQQLIVDKDNEENEKIKEAQAEKDAEMDQRLMKEYAAKLDKDDYQRANAHAERMKKMEAFNAKMESGPGKSVKEERIRMELLLLKDQAEAEANALAKEQKKAADKKARLQRMLHENEKLVDAKQAAKERLRQSDEEYAKKALADVARFHAEEAAKKEKLHSKHMQYRSILDDQKSNKPIQADPKSAAFIGRESLVNRSLYEKAVHDPKVLHKLNSPAKPVQKGPRIATHK